MIVVVKIEARRRGTGLVGVVNGAGGGWVMRKWWDETDTARERNVNQKEDILILCKLLEYAFE